MTDQRIRCKAVKSAGGKLKPVNKKVWDQQVNNLPAGEYEVVIQPMETPLKRMKRHYFALESELANHLGYTKVLLHEQLKLFIGKHISADNGEAEYLSVAKINNEADMTQRILELSEFASVELNYSFKPFNPDDI
jgi:hypothetical protein